MAPRTKFALVFTTDPPSADIFRSDEFEDDGEMKEGVSRIVKKRSWQAACEGQILRAGKFTSNFIILKCILKCISITDYSEFKFYSLFVTPTPTFTFRFPCLPFITHFQSCQDSSLLVPQPIYPKPEITLSIPFFSVSLQDPSICCRNSKFQRRA